MSPSASSPHHWGEKRYPWTSYITQSGITPATLSLGLLFLVQCAMGDIHFTFKKSNTWNWTMCIRKLLVVLTAPQYEYLSYSLLMAFLILNWAHSFSEMFFPAPLAAGCCHEIVPMSTGCKQKRHWILPESVLKGRNISFFFSSFSLLVGMWIWWLEFKQPSWTTR